MYHVALGMPVLVLAVPEYLYKLLQYGCLTPVAFRSKACRVVVVAIDFGVVLVIRVLGAKDCWTDTTCKVFNVVFPVERRDVRAAQGLSAVVA